MFAVIGSETPLDIFELQPRAESAFKSKINELSVTNPLISLIKEISAHLAPESVTNFQS